MTEEKIDQARQKAQAEIQEKIEKSKQPGVDVREIFTDDDFDAICQRNEFFHGKVADLSRVQRHQKLEQAAKWLDAHSMEVVAVEVESVSKSHPNAIVSMEIRRLASLRDKELRAFTAMTALADTIFISGAKDSVVRFAFGIEEVWVG